MRENKRGRERIIEVESIRERERERKCLQKNKRRKISIMLNIMK